MSMLADLLQKFLSTEGGGKPGDTYIEKSPSILENDGKAVDSHWNLKDLFGMSRPDRADDKRIYAEDGRTVLDYDTKNYDNPFKNALGHGGNGPGTISGLLSRLLSPTPERNASGLDTSGVTPRMGGTGDPNHVPGEGQDAVLDPTPMKSQKARNLRLKSDIPAPLDTPVMRDYSQPSALDPQAIEELRQSLMTQAGQMDPNNPNGLSGRMNSPNAASDIGQQRNQAMGIEDSIRGFDGVKPQKIKERTTNAQTR